MRITIRPFLYLFLGRLLTVYNPFLRSDAERGQCSHVLASPWRRS
jgi:hypothetical protein